ncbi:DUF3299 domain-containing protein [Azohydromonas aeria]|uniref:DUF3299 domain-containing protein n=1 Tax=Azohydromonas aeria TaxID=2590212 RepID=UPI0012F8DC43|nr:DUF3299 domain-containing protein [Azohydromonas aeria]
MNANLHRTAHPRRRRLLLALAGLPLAGPLGAAATEATYRDGRWAELVPPDWDPRKAMGLQAQSALGVREGSAQELALMEQLRAAWDNAPTRSELDGAKLRMPGYVVPLEHSGEKLQEFLLVPYFGACIHSPPPPANQIVHVRLARPEKLRSMDVIWAYGTLRTQRNDSSMGVSGYAMDAVRVEPWRGPPR